MAALRHRFTKDSDFAVSMQQFGKSLYLLKLDSARACRHTGATMTRSTRAFAAPTPLAAQMLMLGFVILTVIVILPR